MMGTVGVTGTGAWVGDRGFAGGFDDPGSGVVQVGARVYDPAWGTFLSPDPILRPGDAAQVHGVFSYACQNPVRFSYPSGLLANDTPSGRAGKKASSSSSGSGSGGGSRGQAASSARYAGQASAHATATSTRAVSGGGGSTSAVRCAAMSTATAYRDFLGGLWGYEYATVRLASYAQQNFTVYGWVGQAFGIRPYDASLRVEAALKGAWGTDESSTAYQVGGWVGFGIDLGVGTHGVLAAGKAPTTARSITTVAGGADDQTRVGRWMSPDEHAAMVRTGEVQVGGGATTSVSHPADVSSYLRQARPGSAYAEFYVPASGLRSGGAPGWAQIPSPTHPLYGRLAEKTGVPLQSPVPACNIVLVGQC